MKRLLLAMMMATLLTSVADAAKRKNVYINKPSQPVARQQVPIAVVPVFGIAFDIVRRTTCDPQLAVGGGPGFDPEPKTGNFLIPAIYSRCANRPKRG